MQEYKKAPSLAQKNDFTPEEIKKIALSILEILVYLQTRNEPVFHKDIKPENILVDEYLNSYLIDFGLARIGDNTLAASSVMGGTIGFMSHEQLYENQVTKSSDLYSLGITLICLLTKTPSSQVGQLFSRQGVNFEKKIPPLHPDFIKWLKKMVALESKNRFSNAKSALNQLKSIPVKGLPFSAKLGNGVKNTLTVIGKNKTIFFAKLGNAVENTLTVIGKNKAISVMVIVGIIGIGVFAQKAEQERLEIEQKAEQERLEAEQKAEQERLHDQRQKTVQNIYLTRKCVECDLQYVNLSYANLDGVNLSGANLKDANLRSADLRSANLNGTNLTEAKSLKNTDFTNAIMPNGTRFKN